MKELEEYTIRELKDAIYKKQEEAAKIKSSTLPTDYYPYEETETIINGDVKNITTAFYYSHIEDGSEGHDYITQVDMRSFEGGANEEKIKNAIIHSYITKAKEGGWDSYFEDVSVEELGRYGVTFLKMDITNEPEDDE